MGMSWSNYSSLDKQQECVAYMLQPHCTAFRHMHAFIEDETNNVVIEDLTYNKTFKINNVIDTTKQVRSEDEIPPSMSTCNVSGYHWNLAILQIFYTECVQLCVCDLTQRVAISTFTLCSCFKPFKLLCEAYFSKDRKYLIVKQNEIYARMKGYIRNHRSSVACINHEVLHMIRIERFDEIRYNTYTEHPMGGLVVADHRERPEPEEESTRNLRPYRDRRIYKNKIRGAWYPVLGVFDDFIDGRRLIDCSLQQHCFKHQVDNSVTIDVEVPLLASAARIIFIPIQQFNSSLEYYSEKFSLNLLRRDIQGIEEFEYEYEWKPGTRLSLLHKLPLIGVSLYIRKEEASHSEKVKTLFKICCYTIADLVLPEDIDTLPLPTPLKEELLYGSSNVDEEVLNRWRQLPKPPYWF